VSLLKGVFSVLPTPFLPDGPIDTDSLKRVVALYMNAGVNGLTVLGVTGEAAKLSERERGLILDTVVTTVGGKIPVVAGTSAPGLQVCREYSKAAVAAGAHAVMVSPPRMPKLNTETVVRHFSGLADAIDVPIIVQDFPPVSGYMMEPSLLVRIAREIPSARTIKLEDPPTPLKTATILEQAGGIPIAIFGGLGGMYLLEELISGATGAMTGFAYPEVLVQVVRAFQEGNTKEAADIFYRNVALMRFEFQEGIGLAIRKEMLHRRGAIAHPAVRFPGASMDKKTGEALDSLLEWFQRREKAIWI
jgi:4-hydroxy-tetrahydrodipicolinate synthase